MQQFENLTLHCHVGDILISSPKLPKRVYCVVRVLECRKEIEKISLQKAVEDLQFEDQLLCGRFTVVSLAAWMIWNTKIGFSTQPAASRAWLQEVLGFTLAVLVSGEKMLEYYGGT